MKPATGALRRAGEQDLDAIAKLLGELLAHHAAIEPAFAVRAEAGSELTGLLARRLHDPESAVFVFESAGEVAGFCSVRVEPAPSALVEAARAEISELGVAPGRRRQRVGRALAEAALGWARSRGAQRVEVRVAARNREGQAFWRALGYEGFVDVLQRRL